jgi:hypothetical protein
MRLELQKGIPYKDGEVEIELTRLDATNIEIRFNGKPQRMQTGQFIDWEGHRVLVSRTGNTVELNIPNEAFQAAVA